MRFPIISAFAGAALLAACENNPVYGRANIPTGQDTLTAFALTGTPIGSFSAVNVPERTVTRAQAAETGGIFFDIALDIDATGKIQIIPSKLVAMDAGGGNRTIGIQTSTRAFDDVREAPDRDYKYDSLAVVSIGQTVLFDVRTSFCQGAFLPNVYGKMVVDSTNAQRMIFFRLASDPNCGFRGLVPGEIPKK